MIGVSLPYFYVCHGGDTYGERGRFYQKLRAAGVKSVEIRNVAPDADAKDVLEAARILWRAGLEITVHGSVKSIESAIEDLFAPLQYLFKNLGQEKIMITLHPIDGDNAAMLRNLADHVKKQRLPVVLTLENNRLMPNKEPGDSAGLVADAVGEVDPEIVGINFDMGHFYFQSGFDRLALPSDKFLSRVRHTHIHAVSEGKTHFPLNFDLPLKNYILGLGEGYDGIYNLELEPSRWPELDAEKALFESIELLRKSIPYSCLVKRGLRQTFIGDLADAAEVFDGRRRPDNCRMALTQSSGYLFRTAGINWAMDIFLREAGKIMGIGDILHEALSSVKYMIITHDHADHFEKAAVAALADLPMKWIIPAFLQETAKEYGIKKEKMILANPWEEINLGRMTVMPFEGRHYRPGTNNGAEELGYLVSADGKKLLFPGDVRNYDPVGFPNVAGVDALFYHLWLGDNSLADSFVDYEEQAMTFIRAFSPQKVFISHLYEAGRTVDAMWRYNHAGSLANRLKLYAPEIHAIQTVPGEQYEL